MNEKFNPKNSPIDDWTVSPVAPSPPTEQAANWGMTNPLKSPFTEAPKDGWKMPEPTFRISDGYCPLKSQDTKNKEAPPATETSVNYSAADEKLANLYAPPEHEGDLPDVTMHNISLADLKVEIPSAPEQKIASSAQTPIVAQPQPDVSDQFRLDDIQPKVATETTAKSRSAQTIYVVLGILLMTFFAAAFLALVYYLFFYQPTTV